MKVKVIVIESNNADLVYVVRQVGRRVIVTADSPAQAMALTRRIGGAIAGEEPKEVEREGVTQAVGFQLDPEG